MDKTYLIKQLSDLARSLNLDISEEVISKAVGFSQFKVYSKGEMPAREGSLCIDSGLLGFTEMKAMWEALEDTTVMLFDVKDMKELILGDEHLKTLWIGILESGMRYKVYRESAFLVENATERYLSFRKHYPKLSERVPLRYIATYLGITPESLSRIRSSMKEELK